MRIFLNLIFLSFGCICFCQVDFKHVIASSGDEIKNHQVTLEWTIGETFAFEGNQLISGFHAELELPNQMTTSLLEDTVSSELSIFPNPVEGVLHLSSKKRSLSNMNYSIVDLYGRIVLSGLIDVTEQLNVSSLAPGMFFLFIQDSSNIYSGFINKL